MTTLETVGPDNWKEFIAHAPLAVLMLGKTDCAACAQWTEELSTWLEGEPEFEGVRYGKMDLKTRGLIEFKKANPWLSEVDVLPYTLIYKDGDVAKKFAGGGVERLSNRIKRLVG